MSGLRGLICLWYYWSHYSQGLWNLVSSTALSLFTPCLNYKQTGTAKTVWISMQINEKKWLCIFKERKRNLSISRRFWLIAKYFKLSNVSRFLGVHSLVIVNNLLLLMSKPYQEKSNSLLFHPNTEFVIHESHCTEATANSYLKIKGQLVRER